MVVKYVLVVAHGIVLMIWGSLVYVMRLGKKLINFDLSIRLHIQKVFQFSVLVVSSFGSAGAS